MGAEEVAQFLTHLARVGNVAASTQKQALSAVLFLYQQVLKQEVGWIEQVERAKTPKRVPVVLTRDEVHRIFEHLRGTPRVMAGLLYGSGLRLMECVRLRVKDVDFAYARITVRDAKGGKDRVTMLPINLAAPLERHLQRVKMLHEQDLEEGLARFICLTRWTGNIRARAARGPGNSCFLRPEFQSFRGLDYEDGITFTRIFSKPR